VLALGTVGLLMFNTHMQQVSFRATALQERADALTAREQALSMQLAHLRDPQVLASRAKRLGMVVPPEPAFIRLSDGKVVGDPVVATPADGVRINPYPAPKPARLAPRPLIVHVPAPAQAPAAGQAPATQAPKTQAPPAVTSTATTNGDVTGPASTTSGATTGRKGSTHRTAGHGATH
jgi:hypothetical protein